MTTETIDPVAQKKSRRTLIAIVAISLLPITAAYLMFFTGVGVPTSTVNYGVLLDAPIHIKNIVGEDNWRGFEEDKKWRLLLPVGKSCNDKCEANLYTTRQVHIRLGEKSVRVERIAVNYGGETTKKYLDELQASHPLLKRVDTDLATWRNWQSQSSTLKNLLDGEFYLLVDQEGFAMMVYQEQHGNDLLKDIKRALKYSIDYQ